jgi:hypothetical protein
MGSGKDSGLCRIRHKLESLPPSAISDNSGLDHRSKVRAFGCVTRGNTSAMINVRPLRANCGRTGYSNAGRGAEIGRMRADLSREGCRPHILQQGDRL